MGAALFPEDIICIILERLQVKSLLRLKCVCKSWRSLISDPYFVRNYVRRARAPRDPMLLYYHNIKDNGGNRLPICVSIDVVDNLDNKNMPIDLSSRLVDFPAQLDSEDAVISGSCDGIICIANDDNVMLWNPSISEYNILPPLCPKHHRTNHDAFGIGYDSSTDDYKILRVRYVVDGKFSMVDVLSLKSNTWKAIKQTLPYKFEVEQCSVCTRGRIYWRGFHVRGPTMHGILLAFDLGSETFMEVPLPLPHYCNFSLFLYKDNICMKRLISLSDVEIWVMKETTPSWTKLVSVSVLGDFKRCCRLYDMTLSYFIIENGIVICFDKRDPLSSIGAYNPHKGMCRKWPPGIAMPRERILDKLNLSISYAILSNHNTLAYVPSLVSPIHGFGIKRQT